MKTFHTRLVTAALLGVVVFGLGAGTAQAQFRVRQWGVYAPGINPNAPFYNPAQPFQYVAPGVSLQSALINQVNAGRAIASVPPWVYGYNPYPPVNFGPAFQSPGYNPLYGAGVATPAYNPFLSTGYAGGGYPGSTLSTGGAADYGSTLSTGYNPYMPYVSGRGGALQGGADVIFAEGWFMMDTEQARMMRTKWKMEELDYKKKVFDLNTYIRANTPSYAEVKEKLDQDIIRRVRNTASNGEIWAGQAQNLLLKDFAKHPGKKVTDLEINLPEEVLKKLNVTSAGGTAGGSLGVLRNGGDLDWPPALLELASKDTKRDMDTQAKELYRQAEQAGKVDPATAKDLKTNVKILRDRLVSNVNVIATDQYADAKRFLNDLEDAVGAVQRGDAPNFFAFQKFVKEGKHSIQDVIEFMNARGLSFAPAVSEADQSAYQALHQALAAYNIALNQQLRTTVSTKGS